MSSTHLNKLTMLNHANTRLMILYTVSIMNTTFLVKLWPERMICPTWAIAYVAAKKEPLSHLRRWEMNSGNASGTSVSPMAPLTYLRILEKAELGTTLAERWKTNQFELALAMSSKQRIRCNSNDLFSICNEQI